MKLLNNYMSYYDVPVLLTRGFTFGIADSILWGKDNEQREWQAVVDGEYIYFADRRPSGGVNQLEKLRRDQFASLFER